MAKQTVHLVESLDAQEARARIVVEAARLLASGGRDAVTTRAVCAAAGVQAPTLYRLFGDMRGLLNAVVEHELAAYVAKKSAHAPHPGVFAIMQEELGAGPLSPALVAGQEVLRARVRNVALAGKLRVSEARAVALLRAVSVGTVMTLLAEPESKRDLKLLDLARDAVMATLVSKVSTTAMGGLAGAATALRAALEQTSVLTHGERGLLKELLDRLANEDG